MKDGSVIIVRACGLIKLITTDPYAPSIRVPPSLHYDDLMLSSVCL